MDAPKGTSRGFKGGRIYLRRMSHREEIEFRRAYLLELITSYRWYGHIKAGHSLAGKILSNLVELSRIATLVLEVGEMKASHAIGLQLDEARSYDVALQVNGIRADVAIALHEESGLVGEGKSLFDQLPVLAYSTIGERSGLGWHGGMYLLDGDTTYLPTSVVVG